MSRAQRGQEVYFRNEKVSSTEMEAEVAAQQETRTTLPEPDTMEELAMFVGTRSLAKTIMAPFDRVKVLLQTETELIRQARLPSQGYAGTNALLNHIAQREGILSFWRGNLVNCFSILPTAGCQVLIGTPLQQQIFKAIVDEDDDEMINAQGSGSAVVGGIISSLASAAVVSAAVYPLDVIRFRLQCDAKSTRDPKYLYSGAKEFVTTTWGLRESQKSGAFHRGLTLFLTGSMLYRFAFLTFYNFLCSSMQPPGPDATQDQIQTYTGGVLLNNYWAVLGANLWAYPIDTVRRRMMLTVNSTKTYENMFDCINHIVKMEGTAGFFRGWKAMAFRNLIAGVGTYALGLSFYSFG